MTVNIYVAPQYGCFRCGAINGEFHHDEEGRALCNHCGEHSLLSVQQALDILNNMHISGHRIPVPFNLEEDE